MVIVRDSDGIRRTFSLRDRETRIEGYAWLLNHGDETRLIEHLDIALLVDAWPDIAPLIADELRRHWTPLVLHAAEGWADARLMAGLREGRPLMVNQRARARAIKRLAEHGLTADEIRVVLRRG